MDYSIENDFLYAVVNSKGAELQSLRSKKTGLEYIWQGDPAFWSGRAPILFPIIGALKNNSYIYEGKTYRLPKHGFIRNSELTYNGTSDSRISFVCTDNEETRSVYPFSYDLEFTFRLIDNTLVIDYTVRNKTDGRMYFSIGAHEAFNCPRRTGESFEDYIIQFEYSEKPWYSSKIDLETGLLNGNCVPVFEGDTLPLKHWLFEEDALIFRHIRSKMLKIVSKNPGEVVEARYDGADNLGIWTKVGAPYVCIEPWCGVPDHVDTDGDLTEKDGIITLERAEIFNFTHSYTITENERGQ